MKLKLLLAILSISAAVLSCKEKNVDPATERETNEWIYENMKYWYYWNDNMTTSPDYSKDPASFFESLLYRYDATLRPDGDRFSWIQESAEELEASLAGQSKASGMEYKLTYFPTGSSNVIGVVLYVLPDSPAAKAGFARGDIFSSVNGQKMTGANYSQLLNSDEKLTYTLATINAEGALMEGTTTRDITPVVLQEDPVYFDTLYSIGANKIGYVVYHQFIPEPYQASNKQYDKKLDDIFNSFKNANVNALIVDLRYNPGGYVSSATNLASLIAKATSNDIFYYKEYNTEVTETNMKKYGETYFYDKFASKSQNIGSQLSNVVFLVSSRSASASELLINGLKPYMNVTLVGGKTVGKNVGSVTLTDSKKKVKWGLQPIVSKSLNKDKKSDYNVGFTPDIAASEGNILYPYGNPKDPLLSEALFKITGTRLTRQIKNARTLQEEDSQEITSTIQRKAGRSNMFYDK
ncbi:S41 family peptidase [Dyadobacter psychrophilus]|uniref:C-terminal processing protease CtpA/Prc, contains a PDZ domain n=1 Tax=Dyadobacter psychrophilus TaxID=651661 RepID=A0A1T5GKY9_9BACT|nr:S41 family peptidase [Dyadobacter psychrophilus]SKC09083.1 C-terminal processing protease CtpA/Prc, contains a PDZ domain [Dyadobacter psychrophilus]